jgi:hypothetical protein
MDQGFDPAAASATQRRDRELRVLARTRRLIVITSLGAAAALAGLVAQVKPGKSSAAAPAKGASTATSVTGSVTRRLPALSSADVGSSSSQTNLAPPPQAPAPAPAPVPAPAPAPAAPVVSGGS